MGLDMYLNRHVYVGAYFEHREVHGTIDITANGKKLNIDFSKVSEIVEQAGYWRKANQIHKWFVDHVQDGNDDCRDYYVSREQLLELKGLCEEILAETDSGKRDALAIKLLPAQDGFFFGGTEYDDYYFYTLEETVKILSDLSDDGSYYYRSSW